MPGLLRRRRHIRTRKPLAPSCCETPSCCEPLELAIVTHVQRRRVSTARALSSLRDATTQTRARQRAAFSHVAHGSQQTASSIMCSPSHYGIVPRVCVLHVAK